MLHYGLWTFVSAEIAASRIQLYEQIKADRPLMRDTLNAPWLLTNGQFQWTGNGHSQLPLAGRA